MALIPWPEDPPTPSGESLKDKGMDLALSRGDLPPWKEVFKMAVFTLPQGTVFTSEDILNMEHVGLPSGAPVVHGNSAVGAMMNALARKGYIRKAGYHVNSKRPISHGAELTVWVRE